MDTETRLCATAGPWRLIVHVMPGEVPAHEEPASLRWRIGTALLKLGVECAGTLDDRIRWSREDLATDLSAELGK